MATSLCKALCLTATLLCASMAAPTVAASEPSADLLPGSTSPFHRRVRALIPDLPSFRIAFPDDAAEMNEKTREILAAVQERLVDFEGTLLIESFTDAGRGPDAALAVTTRRAEAVSRALRDSLSPKTRLVIESYGSFFAVGRTPEERAAERVVVLSMIDDNAEAALRTEHRSKRPNTRATTPEPEPKSKPKSKPRSVAKAGEALRPLVAVTAFFAPSGPATYNGVVYRAPRAGELDAHSIAERASASRRGIGVETRVVPWLPDLGLAFGGRYAVMPPFKGTAAFAPSEAGHEVVSEVTAKAAGAWMELVAQAAPLGAKGLRADVGLGLDFDYSIVEVKESYREQRAGISSGSFERAVESTLLVVSARVAGALAYQGETLGVSLRLVGQLPLAEGMRLVDAEAYADDWAKLLKHRSSTGSEIGFGVSLML